MKVICTRLPRLAGSEQLAQHGWITLEREYEVVSILAQPNRSIEVQLVVDDGSLAWFGSGDFMTTDGSLPTTWISRIGEGGVLEFGPETWLAAGFWEAYYDDEPSAVDAVNAELGRLEQREG